jgi:hypothetical protein
MPDEQSSSNESEPAPETAAQAFARLDRRIALMSRAVEHVATERAEVDIPDYSATLGQMNTRLATITQELDVIAEKPAMLLTPEGLATRIDAAAAQSRRADSATLREAREAHQDAARTIRDLVGAVRNQREQRERLLWTAGGSLLAGCLLWSFLPGVVARTLPESWHMPERLARHMVGEPTLWEAGVRIMRADSPEAWRAIADAAEMRRDNRETIGVCEQAASKAKRPVRCTITLGR